MDLLAFRELPATSTDRKVREKGRPYKSKSFCQLNNKLDMLTTVQFFLLGLLAIMVSVDCRSTCKDECILDPEVTEGPYYFDAQLLRSDIR